MTPLAASVPYRTAAEGPLTTSMLSMSSLFRSFNRDGAWPPVKFSRLPLCGALSTRTPSTTMIGSLRSERLVAPRIRMREPLPVVPPLCMTWTPGIREFKRSAVLVGAACCIIAGASIVPTVLPSSRFSCSCPVADTTITSSGTAAGTSAKSSVTLSPARTVTDCVAVANPIRRTCTLY